MDEEAMDIMTQKF